MVSGAREKNLNALILVLASISEKHFIVCLQLLLFFFFLRFTLEHGFKIIFVFIFAKNSCLVHTDAVFLKQLLFITIILITQMHL